MAEFGDTSNGISLAPRFPIEIAFSTAGRGIFHKNFNFFIILEMVKDEFVWSVWKWDWKRRGFTGFLQMKINDFYFLSILSDEKVIACWPNGLILHPFSVRDYKSIWKLFFWLIFECITAKRHSSYAKDHPAPPRSTPCGSCRREIPHSAKARSLSEVQKHFNRF